MMIQILVKGQLKRPHAKLRSHNNLSQRQHMTQQTSPPQSWLEVMRQELPQTPVAKSEPFHELGRPSKLQNSISS